MEQHEIIDVYFDSSKLLTGHLACLKIQVKVLEYVTESLEIWACVQANTDEEVAQDTMTTNAKRHVEAEGLMHPQGAQCKALMAG